MSVQTSKMPSATSTAAARPNLTSSFSVTDNNDEVVCPLPNTDGSSCRKRCSGPKRFRSMQEHVRRAHAEYHIPKLPATEESIILMFNSQPRPKESTSAPSVQPPQSSGQDYSHHYHANNPATPRHVNGGSEAHAALALTNLHDVKSESDYEDDSRRYPHSSIETALPPIQLPANYGTSHPHPTANHARQRELLPSLFSNSSPPGRSSTLPPQNRSSGPKHSRKHSVTKQRHHGHHSKNSKAHHVEGLRRLGLQSDDRFKERPFSAEPGSGLDRWESLLFVADAASSAADDLEDDRTPLPRSPMSVGRMSPAHTQQWRPQNQPNEYQASPLQQNLTPPDLTSPPFPPPAELYPSLEHNPDAAHARARDYSDISPPLRKDNDTQICCARCNNPSRLGDSFACTECIHGFCRSCVGAIQREVVTKCPRCSTVGTRFKPFQLEFW